MEKYLLLISNSTNSGEEYLGWPRLLITDFLSKTSARRLLFIPYAGVTIGWDDYTERVSKIFKDLGYTIYSVHHESDPIKAVEEAEAIVVGGGNTFQLVAMMHRTRIMEAIRRRVMDGLPYMGWSAGANVACPSLKTTNDMPIVQPQSFECLNLIPFQINPHYLDANPEGHGGETREQRILEFMVANPDTYVAGLREATALFVSDSHLELLGKRPMRLFKESQETREISPGSDIDFLLKL